MLDIMLIINKILNEINYINLINMLYLYIYIFIYIKTYLLNKSLHLISMPKCSSNKIHIMINIFNINIIINNIINNK